VQARAVGELGSLAEMRAVASASAEPVVYEPSGDAEEIYERFLAKEAVA
jgi:rhamnulokinase